MAEFCFYADAATFIVAVCAFVIAGFFAIIAAHQRPRRPL